jgi:hypothetical protein
MPAAAAVVTSAVEAVVVVRTAEVVEAEAVIANPHLAANEKAAR